MPRLFMILLLLLIIASVITYATTNRAPESHAVLHWKSDPNPQRYEQIEVFNQWLHRKGHLLEEGEPVVELRLDSANNQSKLIQAVSGVGGDILDTRIIDFQPLGVLADLSEYAKQLNFETSTTYPGLAANLVIDGKQYGYPCNAFVKGLWCNVDAFRKFGMQPPPEIWTPKEFEKAGKEFVSRANKGKSKREYFFASSADFHNFMLPILRSQGLDAYNETLTACNLDDQRYIKLLELVYKWTYEDHLFPSAAEVLSMSTQSGYGGVAFSQFQSGHYAMVLTGRFCLIRMRESPEKINLSLSRLPEYGFANMIIGTRSAGLYKGSTKPELAALFFAYLADKEYNDYIIEGSDGLPPNPKYAQGNPAYLTPKDYPSEGNTHQRELEWAMTIALPEHQSPYYKSTGLDWFKYSFDKYFNNLCNAEEAAKETSQRVNNAIQTVIAENPHKKQKYLEDCKLQEKIDAFKREGRKIPRSWIKNPFYVAYYRSQGMLQEDGKTE